MLFPCMVSREVLSGRVPGATVLLSGLHAIPGSMEFHISFTYVIFMSYSNLLFDLYM